MGLEIERKFLVTGDGWRGLGPATLLRQGYLAAEPERSVRVRLAGERAWLTIKGPPRGLARAEYEWPIPAEEAAELLDTLCLRPLIEKRRHLIEVDGLRWELDEFLGENAGLLLAEVELDDADQAVSLPAWVGREVSHDGRYTNAALSRRPWGRWPDDER